MSHSTVCWGRFKIKIRLQADNNTPWIEREHGKAELLQEGIFFLIHLFARELLLMKKLEIEKTKPTFIISTLKTDIIKVGFSISNFFIAKTSLANNWRSFSSSYLALTAIPALSKELPKWHVLTHASNSKMFEPNYFF